MKYVIAGNGVASVSCIEGIRSVDKTGEITVIAEENRNTYCRPLISYYLEHKTDAEKMKYRSDSFYSENSVTVLTGEKAVKLDTDGKNVVTSSGKMLEYDRFCCCTGSYPFVPPFSGLENVASKSGFMTFSDAEYLEKNVTSDSRVLIAGAGLIGLKCAEGLSGTAKSVTVFDMADRILPNVLDKDCAGFVQRHIEAHGVTVLTSDTAASFSENEAVMTSGKVIPFDILVLAVGVRPDVSLIKNAGGLTGRGITVSERMETSLPGIYAAGDCTEGEDISSSCRRVLAIFPNAVLQGRTAGINMAGGDSVFDSGIPMNSVGFFGLHIASAGCCTGEMYEEKTDGGLKRLFFSSGKLTGFIMVGDVSNAGIYTSLIRSAVPFCECDGIKLKKLPSFAVFSSDYRRKMLGGVV